MSVTPTLTDIPFEVFLDALVPHLEVKEIGSLTMVSKDLKGSCDDNLVWREMYLRTIPRVIMDSSLHDLYHYVYNGGPRCSGPTRTRQPGGWRLGRLGCCRTLPHYWRRRGQAARCRDCSGQWPA